MDDNTKAGAFRLALIRAECRAEAIVRAKQDEARRTKDGSGRAFLNGLYRENPDLMAEVIQETLRDVYAAYGGTPEALTASLSEHEDQGEHPLRLSLSISEPSGKAIGAASKFEHAFDRGFVHSFGRHLAGYRYPMQQHGDTHEGSLIHADMGLMCGVINKMVAWANKNENTKIQTMDARLALLGHEVPNPKKIER